MTIAELEKFMKTFDDTAAIIKALKQKKFTSDPDADDRREYFSLFFWKKIPGRMTYTETVILENSYETVLEYSNYLNEGLQQIKGQIIKAGFTFTGAPTDRTDYKVSVYTKRFTEMSDIEIQLKEQKGSYIVSFHFRTLEIKTIDQ
jgi:hypothetical protein